MVRLSVTIFLFNNQTHPDELPSWWVNLLESILGNHDFETDEEKLTAVLNTYNARAYYKHTAKGYERYISFKSEEDYLALRLTWL